MPRVNGLSIASRYLRLGALNRVGEDEDACSCLELRRNLRLLRIRRHCAVKTFRKSSPKKHYQDVRMVRNGALLLEYTGVQVNWVVRADLAQQRFRVTRGEANVLLRDDLSVVRRRILYPPCVDLPHMTCFR